VLTCDTVLPARFEAGDRPLLQAQSQALLQGLAVAEDVRGDDPENRKETTPAQQRIEAKLDLALSLLGRLARQHEGPLRLVRLRWSAAGCAAPPRQPSPRTSPASSPCNRPNGWATASNCPCACWRRRRAPAAPTTSG